MDVYKKLGIGAKEPEYTEVRKSTSFGGVNQRSRDHGERRPGRGGD